MAGADQIGVEKTAGAKTGPAQSHRLCGTTVKAGERTAKGSVLHQHGAIAFVEPFRLHPETCGAGQSTQPHPRRRVPAEGPVFLLVSTTPPS